MDALVNVWPFLVALALGWSTAWADPARDALPPTPPKFKMPETGVLFADDFSGDSLRWTPDRKGVWKLTRGMLRATLPDTKQERSFAYAGSEGWGDYAVDLDVCQMRGVDKGVVVRVRDTQGIAVDLRGPGYNDVLLHRTQWPIARASVVNGNAMWHHIRIEARGDGYRVFVNGRKVLAKVDRGRGMRTGRIALPAYTGGVGECTVYYDNVVVTELK